MQYGIAQNIAKLKIPILFTHLNSLYLFSLPLYAFPNVLVILQLNSLKGKGVINYCIYLVKEKKEEEEYQTFDRVVKKSIFSNPF